MQRTRPKKDYKPIRLYDKTFGKERRLNYAKEILHKETTFPQPLEYEDIDEAFGEWVENELKFSYNGKEMPTYKLYSNQRFTEFTQMWQNSDKEGNLMMNFKTVNREPNPSGGKNQDDYWNIPGERYYTLLIRDVLDENGTESYEIHSMKQPFTVDLVYRVNFVTNMFSVINEFNTRLNELFKARQCYIRPNGHFIPMVLDGIDDQTTYALDNRKFFLQSCTIRVMAYIIKKEDFKVEYRPKRVRMFAEGMSINKKPEISIEEYTSEVHNQAVDLTIDFKPYYDYSQFVIDVDINVEDIVLKNVRNYRLFINDTPYYTDKGFQLKSGDEVKVKIKPFNETEEAQILLLGYNPSVTYTDTNPENVSDSPQISDSIEIE